MTNPGHRLLTTTIGSYPPFRFNNNISVSKAAIADAVTNALRRWRDIVVDEAIRLQIDEDIDMRITDERIQDDVIALINALINRQQAQGELLYSMIIERIDTGIVKEILEPYKYIDEIITELKADLKTYTTIDKGIERAIRHQLEAGLDILVDGQIRDDMVAIAAKMFLQITGEAAPYEITDRIHDIDSTPLVKDYKRAQKIAAQLASEYERPESIFVKGHIIGPTFMAQSLRSTPFDGYSNIKELREQPSFEFDVDPNIILDIADALSNVAGELYVEGARYIQIDEPSMGYGVDLETGFKAIEKIVNGAPQATWILHVGGDIRPIIDDLLNQQYINVLAVEGQYLREIKDLDAERLRNTNKQILYGCIPVNTSIIPSKNKLAREQAEAKRRFGEENLFGFSPNAGLNLSNVSTAKDIMIRLVEASKQSTARLA